MRRCELNSSAPKADHRRCVSCGMRLDDDRHPWDCRLPKNRATRQRLFDIELSKLEVTARLTEIHEGRPQ